MKNFLYFTAFTFITFLFFQCKQEQMSVFPMPDIEGDFEFIPELSDEFEGNEIDTLKWFRKNPTWLGRQPAFFSEGNVVQKSGMLNLTMRKEATPEELKKEGYHTYSSASVRSKYTVKYGFFEIKSRAMNSKGSSAFWFYDMTPSTHTEIDVFEICGTGDREYDYYMNAHVFRTPLENEHWDDYTGSPWRAPYRLADEFHVFALEWTPFVIRWYVDGDVKKTLKNTHWHQPLTMNFDSETFPDWFGLPDDNELPSTFSIEYVRSWRYKSAEWMDIGKWKNKENQ